MSFETLTIGPCTLIRGDCLEVLKSIAPFDALITDPPYGVEFRGKATKHTTVRTGGYIGDDSADVGPEAVRMAIAKSVRGLVFSGIASAFNYPKPDDIGSVYCPSGAGIGKWGFVCMHPVLLYGKRPSSAMYPTSMTSFATRPANGHPCPKPHEWMEWAVGLASVEGETVCDPFMGSGTTGVACIQSGRRFIGIEQEPEYFALAQRELRKAWKLERSKLPLEPQTRMIQQELITA